MNTSAELRAEAARLREFALTIEDSDVLEEINFMIAELERRARLMDNGDASDGACSPPSGVRWASWALAAES